MNKLKKRSVIILIVVSAILLLAVGTSYIAVNYIFSEISETVGESIDGETVILPVLDENKQIAKDKNISVVLDEEAIKKIEAKIPVSEKLKVLALLAKSLSPEDYKKLISYGVGGVNNEKFNSAYALMRENLGPKEKEIVKSYYAKYSYLLEEK